MIKKLQRKFILLSMSALFFVLTVIIAGINIVNYNGVTQEADKLLSVISENKGEFPMEPDKFGNKLPPGMSPEAPYESRYFSVILDSDSKQIMYVETSRIISVTPTTAVSYANAALEQNVNIERPSGGGTSSHKKEEPSAVNAKVTLEYHLQSLNDTTL